MSVRLGLMALLAEGDSYGARLRSDFEERTGGTWPLNVGQVYTTLERLVRDGLVEQAGEPDAEGRIAYRLTPAGRAELAGWWTTPVDRTSTPRDELTIKLALAVTAPGVDVERVVQAQRTSTLRQLRDLTRLKRDALDRAEGTAEGTHDTGNGLAWLLVLENLVFAAEAEVRWLDHVESVLARHARERRTREDHDTPDDGTAADPEHDHAGAAPAHREGTHA
ncbi:PadR family transcriptional regulator [Phycicoccus sonneratiae]|uniref:PadR family transcriptional regulator n=1 Tax=Phycicoccus sonneratiae TaxID=2807628 RepID=A0ABS2CPN6_9MICO|nr:PadR family transcriptional regulator [Phycicoccus sonneraticus]MBM6401857.1 PadR family transcriptional regulator [Phycicoccus sonneraticus]